MLYGLKGVKKIPGKGIWTLGVPSLVVFFFWNAAYNKILTIDKLIRRRHTFASWCCVCECKRRQFFHLIPFKVHFNMRLLVFALLGCFGSLADSERHCRHLPGWWKARVENQRRKAQMLMWLCFQLLWRDSNKRSTQYVRITVHKLKRTLACLKFLILWIC